jgi:hypothetical protein
MKGRLLFLAAALTGIALSATAVARIGAAGATWYVDAATCPAAGSGSLGNPFCSIQAAICAAASGDLVSVAPGTYPESLRMRPNVDLISEAGPASTIIDGTGKPCTETDYCTKRTGQCSTVLFGSGHTPGTLLDGFTITGGSGTVQSVNNWVAGGGVFVFSSPTINNNIITNNVITGSENNFFGGGIFISLGEPVITNNVISGNRAVPGAGTSKSPTTGYGAGIYVGFSSGPIILDNTIRDNVAGSVAASNSVGSGGGIAVFPGTGAHPVPIIDRNLIADNDSSDLGGGIHIIGLDGSVSDVMITNNVIVGNTSADGGGIYTAYSRSSIINNTITGNGAKRGGGLESSTGDVTLPVVITNNIVEGNQITDLGGDGGGIFTYSYNPSFFPAITFNDLYGNEKNEISGTLTEGMVIGSNGNFSADPLYIDPNVRDFHLDALSPAIDTASAGPAPSVDFDVNPRGVDGDGTPDSPESGDVDVGAYEFGSGVCMPEPEICDNLDNDCDGTTDAFATACGIGECAAAGSCTAGADSCTPGSPVAEVCDGLDNNCDGMTDNGFPDSDGDLVNDCLDPDDDDDGSLDGADCAPLDPGSWGTPYEVAGFNITMNSPSALEWIDQIIGPATNIEILSGLISRMASGAALAESFCLVQTTGNSPWTDMRPDPPLNDGYFYISRTENACGASTFGEAVRDSQRSMGACNSGIVDFDSDGSPSDLDCDDTSASMSPLAPEICDNLDNNCDGTTDSFATVCGVGACAASGSCAAGSDSCVPGTPTAEVCDNIDNDCDGTIDAFATSCGIGECASAGSCALGSNSCTPGSPVAESCDGLDNDCDGVTDNNIPDTDGDLLDDCVDPDDDNDGVDDPLDCAPLDNAAWSTPTEVADLTITGMGPTDLAWTTQALGPGTLYDVTTGVVGSPGSVDYLLGTCVTSTPDGFATDNGSNPPVGSMQYYLVKARNTCGGGTFGSPDRDSSPSCP